VLAESPPLAVAALSITTASVATAAATPLMRLIAKQTGFMSRPNPIVAQHRREIAYLGGVAVAIGTAAGAAVAGAFGTPLGSVTLILGVAFLALGTIDDLRALPPAPKFLCQALVAGIAVHAGIRGAPTGITGLDAALSWLWICTLVNAFNFVDVCDGLLSSVVLVALVVLSVACPGQSHLALPCAGACIGFLLFNWPPATIFLGDAGSHFLGFLAAATSLLGVGHDGQPLNWLAIVLMFSVPLFELVFITAVRIRLRIPWWRGSPDHFALRMQAAGWSRPGLIGAAAGTNLLVAGAAVACAPSGMGTLSMLLALTVAGSAFVWRRLSGMPRGNP
jgi:UDP-GlcNAc:undecaprenyl-phosphate GlcNAc-1-phosphate transferase